MDQVEEVFARYKLKRMREITVEEEINRLEKASLRSRNGTYNFKFWALEVFLIESGPIQINDREYFKKMIGKDGIKLPFEDGWLDVLYVVRDFPPQENVILKFAVNYNMIGTKIMSMIKNNKKELEEWFPEFFIEYVFHPKDALNKIEEKIWNLLEKFAEDLKESEYIKKMQMEMISAMKEKYEEIENKR